MRLGYTLPELIVVLLLMGIASTAVVPAMRDASDRLAVTAAREAVAGAVVRARSEATLHDGAVLKLREVGGLVWIQVGDSVVALRHLTDEFQVTVDVGSAREADLVFDPLGLGRRASRTVVIRRGRAEVRLVVAAYGRAIRS